MPFLEILYANGNRERRKLKKQTPVSIGAHTSNDIVVDEPGVSALHCRISWSKGAYEAVAASQQPLDVNGTPKQRTRLVAGDVLRIGSADLRFSESEDDQEGDQPAESALGLKPLSGELESERPRRHQAASPARKPSHTPKPPKLSRTPAMDLEVDPFGLDKTEEDDIDSSALDNNEAFQAGLDQLAAESLAGQEHKRKRAQPRAKARAERKPSPPEGAEPTPPPKQPASPAPSTDDSQEVISDRMRQAMRSRASRPGEEDPLRSPLVLSLAGGAAALLLTGAIFYFIATRQTTQQAFDAARQAYDEGNYRASIEALKKFIDDYPRQPLAVDARRLLGFSRIRQLIEGGAPKYAEGLEQLRQFIEEQRDVDGFESLRSDLMGHAQTIALGAAAAAGKQFDPALLDVSRQATTLVKTYAPKETPPVDTLNRIQQAQREAEALILRDDVYQEHIGKIDQALENGNPLQALQLRRALLVRYPKFETDRGVVQRMQSTLEAELARVTLKEQNLVAETDDHDWPQDVLTLAFSARTRTDEVPSGQAVLVLAQDCCYGVDQITGQPLWRRVIGFQTPFFPLVESGSSNAILFDTNFQEVVRLDRNSGQLRWRLPIHDDVTGQPVLAGDRIYVTTRQGQLLSIDVKTGELAESLNFSQPINSPVVLPDGQRMVVAGNQEVLYLLTIRPLACIGVFDLGHSPGSIQAPLIAVADYVVAMENRNNRSLLQLLEVGKETPTMKVVATGNVTGQVLDPPAIRGRDLFVPSTGERVSAFSLSDDPGQPPLTAGPVYVSEGREVGSASLLTGPDRQLWMATAALSRLRLTTDALQRDGDPIATGITSQPLQFLSGSLFHGRHRPYTQAVTLTRTDRDEMKSDWQAVLGSPVAAWTVSGGGNGAICAVTEVGQTYRISPDQITGDKFLTTVGARLPVEAQLRSPLRIGEVSRSRIAVAGGQQKPQLWVINPAAQIEMTVSLKQPPQAAPCALGDTILVPLEGMVQVVGGGGLSSVQEFRLPTGDSRTWVSLSPLGPDQAAAVTDDGEILLLKLSAEPQPHLAEVARISLGKTVHHPAVAGEGLFAIADQSHQLSVFESERLQPRGSRTFEEPISGSPHLAGGKVFVELGQKVLHCLDPDNELKSVWSLSLSDTSLAGVLQQQDGLYLALRNGDVLVVNPENGQEQSRTHTWNALVSGPVVAGEKMFVTTADGSLIRIR